MLQSEIRDNLLVDEQQLGGRLNQALQRQDRADFALLLAMLSPDVTDAPLFNPPEKQQEPEVDLRRRFGLMPAPRLYAEARDFARAASEAGTVQRKQGMSDVRLSQCLAPEPLVAYERQVAPEVLAGLTPLKQHKLRLSLAGKALAYEKIHETGEGFAVLDEIKQSTAGAAASDAA